MERESVLTLLSELALKVLSRFHYVTVGAQDTSRADLEFLKRLATLSWEVDALRLRLADTMGILTPFAT